LIESPRNRLATESSRFGRRKNRFLICAFSKQHNFCQVLLTAKTILSWLFWVDAGMRLAREVHVSERAADCDHTSAAASNSRQRASRHRLRPNTRLGNPHQYARPAMRAPARGSRATASASSPGPVSVVIDDWLKSFSAFGLRQELVG
jgi:hypothetical protein